MGLALAFLIFGMGKEGKTIGKEEYVTTMSRKPFGKFFVLRGYSFLADYVSPMTNIELQVTQRRKKLLFNFVGIIYSSVLITYISFGTSKA